MMGKWNDNIKMLCKANGWQQWKLGEKIGVKQTTIAAYEAGRNKPNVATFVRLADCFGVSLDYLMGVEDAEIMSLCKKFDRIAVGDRYIVQRILDAVLAHPGKSQNNVPKNTSI